ncbi:hypothetical protein ACFL6G_05050 [candidate division KSB1 bacterium]
MKKKYFREFLLISIVIIIGIHSGNTDTQAQFFGNPVALEEKTWSIGAAYDFQKYDFDGHEYSSIRSELKVDFALNKYLNTALYIGTANLRILYPLSRDLDEFRARIVPAFGGSVKGVFPVPNLSTLKVFTEAGIYRFNPHGTTFASSDPEKEEVYLDITWREFWGAAGVIYRTKTVFDTYIGVQTRAIMQNEKVSRNGYNSGAWLSLISGFDLRMPGKFALSAQCRVLNGYAFSVGISQTGLLTKN